jgi:hypothetical protein
MRCARVDSNHHGEQSPQGPQPHSPVPYASVRVQIVRFVRDRGRIGHIGRNDLGQRWATPRLRQVDPSRNRASQCRTRVRAEHLFDRVFTRPSSLGSEAAHRQPPACHNDRREAEARALRLCRRGWPASIQRWSRSAQAAAFIEVRHPRTHARSHRAKRRPASCNSSPLPDRSCWRDGLPSDEAPPLPIFARCRVRWSGSAPHPAGALSDTARRLRRL